MASHGGWTLVPAKPSVRAVRRFWAALQARDWPKARSLLYDVLTVWWTSGERINGADALIDVNARYPEDWPLLALPALILRKILGRTRHEACVFVFGMYYWYVSINRSWA